MLSRIEELEAFKSRVNLGTDAEAIGYVTQRKESSRNSIVMSHPDGDKIVVAMGAGGHWTFFSVRDAADNGSIIDFVQRRRGGSLGDVRRELRPYLDEAHSPAPSTSVLPILEPASKDLAQVRARLEGMSVSHGHPYLVSARKIPAEVLGHPRFFNRVRIDSNGNAVFPHWSLSGLSGYELKNHQFTGFAPGGQKGLWASHTDPADTALVIAETAIDALSHFALKRPEKTRYVSTAGTLNPSQPELIRRAAARLPDGGSVILATDNDAGGDALADVIRELLESVAGRILVVEDRPQIRGADWNDVLKANQ